MMARTDELSKHANDPRRVWMSANVLKCPVFSVFEELEIPGVTVLKNENLGCPKSDLPWLGMKR